MANRVRLSSALGAALEDAGPAQTMKAPRRHVRQASAEQAAAQAALDQASTAVADGGLGLRRASGEPPAARATSAPSCCRTTGLIAYPSASSAL